MDQYNCTNLPHFSLSGNTYRARLLDVHDGDTITVGAEVFPGRAFQLIVRLLGINAPEMSDKQKGEEARTRLVSILIPSIVLDSKRHLTRKEMRDILQKQINIIQVKCQGMDKYGRVLAEVYAENSSEHAGDILLREGLAKSYLG